MSETTKVTDRGQTTLPQERREQYGIEPGDEVEWIETADGIVVKKVVDDHGGGMLVDDDVPREKRAEVAKALREEIREMRETGWDIDWARAPPLPTPPACFTGNKDGTNRRYSESVSWVSWLDTPT